MREIKFRAWVRSTEPNQMVTADRVTDMDFMPLSIGYDDAFQSDDLVLMQYTGLKDKNGTEIYEGDIVSTWYDENDEVKWGEGGWLPFINTIAWPTYWEENQSEVEVIGNIYENPELLEAK